MVDTPRRRAARAQPGDDSIAARRGALFTRDAEQFYFVLPDRFANDRGGLSGDRLVTGLDPTAKGFDHGGDLKGVLDRLYYIQDLGTTAIWLAPIFKSPPVQGEGTNASAGYHGYRATFTRSTHISAPTPTSSGWFGRRTAGA